MGSMNIPAPIKAGALKLKDLSPEQVKELMDALRAVSPSLFRSQLTKNIASQAQAIASEDVRDIIRSLVSFHGYRQMFDRSTAQTAEDIATSDDLQIPVEQQADYQELITPFLEDIESLSVTGKAIDLLYARERILTDAKVLTDIRPIFRESDVDSPIAAMITQTLEVTYIENPNSDRKEMFLAIDANDIAKLRKVLDRAEAKAKALSKTLQNTGVLVLEETDEAPA